MATSYDNNKLRDESCNIPIYEELGVRIAKGEDSARPDKAKTFLNPKMRTNRELILLCLAVKVRGQGEDVTSCLDAFSASGIQALQWKKHFGAGVAVTANDVSSEVVEGIRENCRLNGCGVKEAGIVDQSCDSLETACKNANVLLHERVFKFIHLDPFGTSVNFLDAAFSNLPNGGTLSVTSTDISAFLGKCPQVTMRHYGGHMTKCEYLPELACRLIVASLVRAAARCHKGLEVLFVFAKEHFILTVVRVRRGYKKADQSLGLVQRLIHCNLCEERTFIKDTLLAEDNLYSHLPCTCYKSNPGKTASLLGPVWSGGIFDPSFVADMQSSSEDIPGISVEVKGVLEKARGEAVIGRDPSAGPLKPPGKRDGDHQNGQNAKVSKIDPKLAPAVVTGDRVGGGDVTGSSGCTKTVDREEMPRQESDLDPCGALKNSQKARGVCATDLSTHVKGQAVRECTATCDMGAGDGQVSMNDQEASAAESSSGGTNAAAKVKLVVREETGAIPFFYTVVRHCPDKGHWPRMKVVIDALIARGHQAAPTIFHHHGVRTTATLEQFIQTLKECKS